MKGYWSTLGIVLGAFLVVFGFIGWALGIEFSDTVRHSITVPYALLALVVSPILIIGGTALFFVSLYVRSHEKPIPPPPPPPPELVEYRRKRSKVGLGDERVDNQEDRDES